MKYRFKDFPEELQDIYLKYWGIPMYHTYYADISYDINAWIKNNLLSSDRVSEKEKERYKILIAPFVLSSSD